MFVRFYIFQNSIAHMQIRINRFNLLWEMTIDSVLDALKYINQSPT